MIELRWYTHPTTYYTRKVWRMGEEFEENYPANSMRVLQYRQIRDNISWHGKAGAIVKKEWTEWQDVPEINGDDAASPRKIEDTK